MNDKPEQTDQDQLESAVYFTNDICRLFGCGINEIDKLIKAGVIPPCMPRASAKGTRRWQKARVNRKLGIISLSPSLQKEIRQVVSQEIQRMFHPSDGR